MLAAFAFLWKTLLLTKALVCGKMEWAILAQLFPKIAMRALA